MDASLPFLRWGSRGDAVRNLQAALDLWPKSVSPALSADGIFGAKTHAKVLEFQRGEGLASDGLVGPNTWGALASYLEQVLGGIQHDFQVSQEEQEIGARIVKSAELALSRWGWQTRTVTENPACPSIAAARAADPKNGANPRPRQGGLGLEEIFRRVGVTTSCLTITREAEHMWARQDITWLNQHDIPQWCGIFCYYVYSTANVKLAGNAPMWVGNDDVRNPKKFSHIRDLYKVPVGSIAHNLHNHYRVVTANDLGHSMEFIEGNTATPNQDDDYRYGINSVIRRSRYPYSMLQQPAHSQDFYFPVNP